jgi:hypothetical protein
MVRDDLEERREESFEVDEGLNVAEFLDERGIERQEGMRLMCLMLLPAVEI